MRVPSYVWGLVKEVARHLLRRPVVGVVVIATDPDGNLVLIRRGDTGGWAPPGGTLEWGETLRDSVRRELDEEAGVTLRSEGTLMGVYSLPGRDPRFHAVTVVVAAEVTHPSKPPMNGLEILEVRAFAPNALPAPLSHGADDLVRRALAGELHWE